MKKHTLTAILTKEEDMYVAENPETGVVSQGRTIDEATANLKEAVELYLGEFPLPKLKETQKPFMTLFEVIEHAKAAKTIWS